MGDPEIFLEVLPDGCPPSEAYIPQALEVVRAVSSLAPTIDDFASHAAKNIPIRGDISPCRWASCSVFVMSKIARLPRIRDKPYNATLVISAGAGRCSGGNGHVDWWISRDFNPISAIVRVEERTKNG